MPPVNFYSEVGKPMDWNRLMRLLGDFATDVYRRLQGAGSATITVVSGSSSSSSGTSTTAEMKVGRASVGAGSVVVTFTSSMSTTDYELYCFMQDSSGVPQGIDVVNAVKTVSGFTVDTYAAGTLIYIAIPRQ